MTENILSQLYKTIKSRKGEDTTKSYTSSLFAKGRGKITKKLGEEAVETIIAALSENKENIIYESADLIYHLLVLLADCDINLEEVYKELEKRTSQSGIEEKNQRSC